MVDELLHHATLIFGSFPQAPWRNNIDQSLAIVRRLVYVLFIVHVVHVIPQVGALLIASGEQVILQEILDRLLMLLALVLDFLLSLCLLLLSLQVISIRLAGELGVVDFIQVLVGDELAVAECLAQSELWVRLRGRLVLCSSFLARHDLLGHVDYVIWLLVVLILLVILRVIFLQQRKPE